VTLTEQADGLFWMDIDTSFASTQTPPSDPSLTQLAFNLNGDYSSIPDPFTLVTPFCTPNSPSTTTTCDGSISLEYDLDNVGVSGSGQTSGYDLLVQLPPPGLKLDNSQSPIRLYIQGPSSSFSVVDFFEACSNGALYDGGCPTGDYQTVAKVQELNGNPNSTVISGTGTFTPGGEPEDNSVPGPLPIIGAATAFGFSRKLRQRIGAQRRTAPYAL